MDLFKISVSHMSSPVAIMTGAWAKCVSLSSLLGMREDKTDVKLKPMKPVLTIFI